MPDAVRSRRRSRTSGHILARTHVAIDRLRRRLLVSANGRMLAVRLMARHGIAAGEIVETALATAPAGSAARDVLERAAREIARD